MVSLSLSAVWGDQCLPDICYQTRILIAANPASDVETCYTKIRDLRELA